VTSWQRLVSSRASSSWRWSLGIARRAASSWSCAARLGVASSHAMGSDQDVPQSAEADRLQVVADDAGGCCWEICWGGVCVRDRSGARLRERYRALLTSQCDGL